MKNKTRTTAARLDRYEKPDRWPQRRVEEGFAVHAECVANNRILVAIKKLTLSIEKSILEILDNAPTKIPNNDNLLDGESFADTITGGHGNELDKVGRLQCFGRLHWIENPEIESWKFSYDPTWLEDDKLGNLWHLVWNYEETDAGLRERIRQHLQVK